MPEKHRPLNCFLVVLVKQNKLDPPIFLDCFNKTIIPLTLVGYEMIIDIISYPTRARGIIVKYTSDIRC